MSLFDVGRVCVKIAGRDAGKTCVVLTKPEKNYVLVDGGTRRKKCNINHLEPLEVTLSIDVNAPSENVQKALRDAGLKAA